MYKVVMIVLIVFNLAMSRTVISWVDNYDIQKCKLNMAESFGAYSAKDGLTDLALKFWTFDSLANVVKTIDHTNAPVKDEDIRYFVNWGKINNIKILMSCINYGIGVVNWDVVDTLLSDSLKTQKLISELIQVVNTYDLDGIDINFTGSDGLWGTRTWSGRKEFAAFIITLSGRFKSVGKKVNVQVIPNPCAGAPSLSWVSDFGNYVDNISAVVSPNVFPGGNYYIENCFEDSTQNKKVYSNYQFIMDYCINNIGLNKDVFCIGMPGGMNKMGFGVHNPPFRYSTMPRQYFRIKISNRISNNES